MEKHMHEIEAELAAARSGDANAVAKNEQSMTSKVKTATEEATKWEAKADDAIAKLDEQSKTAALAEKQAAVIIQHAKSETEKAVSAKSEAEAEAAQSRLSVSEATKAAEVSMKMAQDKAEKIQVSVQKKSKAAENLQGQIVSLQRQVRAQTEKAAEATSAVKDEQKKQSDNYYLSSLEV
jgi:hypothetical protein